jgi:hypothetical protein
MARNAPLRPYRLVRCPAGEKPCQCLRLAGAGLDRSKPEGRKNLLWFGDFLWDSGRQAFLLEDT